MKLTGYEHQVQYYETDQMGCVHHSNYIRWFEEARTAYLDRLDMGYARMEREGIMSPVLQVQAEYKSMTRYGEKVSIEMEIVKYNGIRLTLAYRIKDFATGQLRCTGTSSHCFLDREGRIVSLKKEKPQWDKKLRTQMEEM
ncbi:MAG TPA: acyl-CoA thioesterase [Candidatus Pullilachnospira intestinigallinarum]|nr:acyl-CoA thioesterase [Candidatus Pullilachnospira intestinigallinarum]